MYRILIADGDEASRDLLAQALSIEDCQIEVAKRGAEVIRQVATGDVDVLIAEVHLSDMSVWDLIPAVNKVDQNIPVVIVTSDESWETSRRVRAAGMIFFYEVKPLNLREMQVVVGHAARWRQRRSTRAFLQHGRRRCPTFALQGVREN